MDNGVVCRKDLQAAVLHRHHLHSRAQNAQVVDVGCVRDNSVGKGRGLAPGMLVAFVEEGKQLGVLAEETPVEVFCDGGGMWCHSAGCCLDGGD